MTDTQSAIVGIILLFPDRLVDIVDKVRLDWFTGDHKIAYEYLAKNDGSDVVAMCASTGLKTSTVMGWMDNEFSLVFLPRHIENLEKEAISRKVKFLGKKLLSCETNDEALSLVDRFLASMHNHGEDCVVTIQDGAKSLVNELERRYNSSGALLGTTYGITEIDEATEGLHPGDLVIIAGPSSMGKTAFAVGVAEAACSVGKKVAIFSVEMTVEQLLMRTLSAESGIPLGKVRAAKFQGHEWGKVMEALTKMNKWPMVIDASSSLNIVELSRRIKKHARDGVELIFIDYLQILSYDKSRENQELDIITTQLKILAKSLRVCIVLLSQLKRGVDEKKKPSMHDLRGSGMIENNADVILFPWREAAYCQKCLDRVEDSTHSTAEHQSMAEIIIGKQRQGERNISIEVTWIGKRTRFVGITKGGSDGYHQR